MNTKRVIFQNHRKSEPHRVIVARVLALFLIATTALSAITFDRLFEEIQDELLDMETATEEEVANTYYRLEELFMAPCNINRANAKKLMTVPFFTATTVEHVIERRKTRRYEHIHELVEENIISEAEYDHVRFFVSVGDASIIERSPLRIKSVNNAIVKNASPIEMDETKVDVFMLGFQNIAALTNDYEFGGNVIRFDHKIQLLWKDRFEGNFIIQRDAYERDYLDLLKFSFALTFPNVLNSVVGGAINAHIGQKLLFSTSTMAAAKSTSTFMTYGKNTKLDINRGFGENYLLGAGTQLRFTDVLVTLFYGAFNYDAEILSGSYNAEGEYVKSMNDYSPAHDSTEAYNEKNAQYEHVGAVNVDYYFSKLSHVGAAFVFPWFTYPLKPTLSENNFYAFYGQTYPGASVHWNLTFDVITLFGEVVAYFIPSLANPIEYAFQDDIPYTLAPGAIAGVDIRPSRTLRYFVHLRYFSKNMPDFHSRAFEVRRGDFGFYNALSWYIIPTVKWSVYLDLVKNTYLRSDEVMPFETEFATEVRWKVYEKLKLTARQRIRLNEDENDAGEVVPNDEYDTSLELLWKDTAYRIRTKNIIAYDVEGIERGFSSGMYFDLDLHFTHVSILSRYMIYNAESVPLYTVNRNLPGVSSGIKTLTGVGTILTVVQKYRIGDVFNLSIHYTYEKKTKDGADLVNEEAGLQLSVSL